MTVSVPAALDGGEGDRGVGAVGRGSEKAGVYVYNVSVDQNMRMLTDVRTNVTEAPCL